MITRVLDSDGTVLHDCNEVGCTVSWDGIALQAHTAEQVNAADSDPGSSHAAVAAGEAMPGGGDVDTSRYIVRGKTAQLHDA